MLDCWTLSVRLRLMSARGIKFLVLLAGSQMTETYQGGDEAHQRMTRSAVETAIAAVQAA
jgi:hypothetical protein